MTRTESLLASTAAAFLSASALFTGLAAFWLGSLTPSVTSALQVGVLIMYVALIYILNTMSKRSPIARRRLWQLSVCAHAILICGWLIALGKLAILLIAPEAICTLLHWPALALANKEAHLNA